MRHLSLHFAVDVMPRLAGSLSPRSGGRHPIVEIILVLFEEGGKQRKLWRVVPAIGQVKSTDIRD